MNTLYKQASIYFASNKKRNQNYLQGRSANLVSTGVASIQDPLLQQAFACQIPRNHKFLKSEFGFTWKIIAFLKLLRKNVCIRNKDIAGGGFWSPWKIEA